MKLNENQLKQLADFASNLSLVFFATAIAPIFTDPQNMNLLIIIVGFSLSLVSLFASMVLLRKL